MPFQPLLSMTLPSLLAWGAHVLQGTWLMCLHSVCFIWDQLARVQPDACCHLQLCRSGSRLWADSKVAIGPHRGLDAAQIDKCFGFDTAVEESQRALLAAKVEAASALKGIGVVKLMGRQSGFIAMQASMASGAHASCDLLCLAGVHGACSSF